MFWVTSYYLKEHKAAAYQQWLQSEEARQLYAAVEEETGLRFVEVYWSILWFGQYDCEEWWEVPDWAALDTVRDSKAMDRLITRSMELGFRDESRGQQTRMLRTTADVKTDLPPESKGG
jgi:hypothetical protein